MRTGTKKSDLDSLPSLAAVIDFFADGGRQGETQWLDAAVVEVGVSTSRKPR